MTTQPPTTEKASDTPICDEAEFPADRYVGTGYGGDEQDQMIGVSVVDVETARDLEKQLTAAQRQIEELKIALKEAKQ